MNTSSKSRGKSRIHTNTTNSVQNNSKPQMRQKPSNERPVTPEGVYFNARLMHCTTSLVGCVVQIQTKDGTRYEGVLRTFSPEFELVVDYVTKLETNYVPIVGSNIGNLLVSLQSSNAVSPRVIFKFQDVVKLNALNVDLEFAANKSHLLTDSEISRFDSKQLNRDKELVPWDDGHGDSGDGSLTLDDHNGVGAQNGWSPDEMFKVNETKFQLKSTYDPSLPDYTCPLVKGEGPDFEEKQKTALELAKQIESDPSRTDRYDRENADEEEKYSAVVRPNDDDKYNDSVRPNDSQQMRTRNRKPNPSPPNPSNYPISNNSGGGVGSGSRQQRTGMASNTASTASAFHSNKNSNNYNKQFSSVNSGPNYQNQTHKPQNYREEQPVSSFSAQKYSKSGDNEESSHQNTGTQRSITDSRRNAPTNKRKEEMTDLKKFSNDFKLPSNVDTPKEKDSVCLKNESHLKNTSNSGFSAKSKSPVGAGDPIPVKDKSVESVGQPLVDDSLIEKESRDVRDSSEQRDSQRDSLDSLSANSPTGSAPDTEIAKKSTLNPNAKTFTPRSPMTPLTTSATPPSVSSTPSSTVSVPISGQLTHSGQHSLSQGHSQQTQVGPSQSATHASQARFPNPLVQIPHQYNVLTPGLTPLLHNQYLMTNVAAMAPSFAQSNPNQQRNYRNKGPQQYTHGVRHEFAQQSAHVAAAVTGHPVLAAAPIGTPQTVSYGPQQTTAMVAQQAPPQHMYQHMYQFSPRMNVLPQHSAAMQMAVPQAVQYDPTQLQHIYSTVGAVQLQHLVSQAHQHMTNSGPHSGHSTPQSATPTTPLHGGPAPSPVHHQPNQPPTPTPQQTVMYTTAHNPQNANVGHHTSSGAPYHNIVILPTGQAVSGGHHSGGHGPQLHAAAHALSHSSNAGNHSGQPALLPVHLIASSNAAQNALAASFNANAGV